MSFAAARRADRAAARATSTARSAPPPKRLDSRSLMNRAGRETAHRPARTRTRETRQPATAARPRPRIWSVCIARLLRLAETPARRRRRGRRCARASPTPASGERQGLALQVLVLLVVKNALTSELAELCELVRRRDSGDCLLRRLGPRDHADVRRSHLRAHRDVDDGTKERQEDNEGDPRRSEERRV